MRCVLKFKQLMCRCSQVEVFHALAVQGLIRRGQKNFDPKEDLVVVAAWLNTSKDPVRGANQPHDSFWSRIHAFYEKHKTTEAFRTESSIMHRWMTILDQVNKFYACYEAIERRNQSGATIQDKV